MHTLGVLKQRGPGPDTNNEHITHRLGFYMYYTIIEYAEDYAIQEKDHTKRSNLASEFYQHKH